MYKGLQVEDSETWSHLGKCKQFYIVRAQSAGKEHQEMKTAAVDRGQFMEVLYALSKNLEFVQWAEGLIEKC